VVFVPVDGSRPSGIGAGGTKVGHHFIGVERRVVGTCLQAGKIALGATPLDLEEAAERKRDRAVHDRAVTRVSRVALRCSRNRRTHVGSHFETHEVGRLATELGGSGFMHASTPPARGTRNIPIRFPLGQSLPGF